jgi:hypothetical protein
MNQKRGKHMKLLFTVLPLALMSAAATAAPVISDLFGTWNGTWSVDEQFFGPSNPLSPPFPVAAVQFNIGPVDTSGYYGTLFVDNAVSGVISFIEVTGNNVNITIDYPTLGLSDLGFVTGVLTGNTILGDFDEIPTQGFVTWKGSLEMTKAVVPVPAAVWLFGSGLIALTGLARRKAQH